MQPRAFVGNPQPQPNNTMQVSATVTVNKFRPVKEGDNNQVQRDVARNLLEAVAAQVSIGQLKGTVEHAHGTATFEVEPDAKAK